MSLMGRAKDVYAIPNLPCIISKEGFQNVKLSYLRGMWVLFEFDSLALKEKFLNHSDDQDDLSSDGESQEGDVANKADNNESDVDRVSKSSFITLLTRMSTFAKKDSDEPKFPPGFTPDNNVQEKNVEENIKDTTERVQSLSNNLNDCFLNRGFSSQQSMNSHSQKSKAPTSSKLLIISIYAPQELNERRDLWDYLHTFIDRWEGDTVIMGDFNEELNIRKAMKIFQKAKIRWSIEGDENSKYFHDQVQDLKHTVTYEEVKRAVWDCGTNKSPGPDEFSFEFYLFIGEWNNNNIQTLLSVLRCFYLASSLKINLHKNKLMGIGVSSNVIAAAASLIGCSILTAPFNYLGVKVGSNMSRITSWDDVISRKLKLLSIGSRLSLLKSVLTSIPLYHMSIFKVLIGVLNHLESIRCNFFNGVDGSDRKLAWIGWNMVLTSKKWWMPRGGVEQKNYGLLCSKVSDLVLPNISDRWCWSLEGSQDFSVKSSRILIDNTILPKAKVLTRWLRVIPIKVNVHAWRVCLGKLPTIANLSLRGIDIPSIACPFCNSVVESSSHISFACPLASQV
uniref:RNA-directed DNA polymerase, eukaryota n=1 Tax=Tanacetum cinerariifolium TaxID=118510 RepID=A0A699HZF7_TANCI|nr:RNA-directed DNA polymerase, eukaryota [Tanacetum cinerariifolium]